MLGEKESDKSDTITKLMKSIAKFPLKVLAIGVSGIVVWLLLTFIWRLAVMLYERFLSTSWHWRW